MRSRRSHLTLCIGTLAIVTLGLSVSFAQQVMSWNLFSGQPAIQITSEPLYYVWFDQGGWHVRWSTIGPSLFSGQIVTPSEFTDVRSQGRLASWVLPQGGRLVFLTGTIGGIDGFDFRTTGSSDTLTFTLMHNQRLISPQQVIVGAGSVRASAMPFTVTSAPVFPAATAGTGSGYDPVERVSGPGEGK